MRNPVLQTFIREDHFMRVKEGFVIRKLGGSHVIVTIGPAVREFNGMIRLNSSGAFLWQSIRDGADTRDKLLKAMLERYDGLDEQTAGKDLDEFLKKAAV